MPGTEDSNTYQKRTFHGVTPSADYCPTCEEDGTGDGRADENSIYIANLGESCNSPEEVDGA
jgi:hypothetical protein